MARLIESENFTVDDAQSYARASFSKNYYDKGLLLEVGSEFSEFVYLVIEEKKDSFEVIFISKNAESKISEVVFEFFNYLLGITVSRLKV